MKYAAVIKTSYNRDDGYGIYYSQEAIEWKDFKDKSEMEAWVKLQVTGSGSYGGSNKYRLIEYQELTVETSVVVRLK